MQLLSLDTIALALLVLAITGVVVPTGAASGGSEDQVWDDPAIVLEPASGPNGQYASIGADGNLTVDISDVNVESVTIVREVFSITNTESASYEVWVSHDAAGAVEFFVDGRRSLEDSGNPVELDPAESRLVSLAIDSRGAAAGEVLMTELTLHAERVATPTPTPTAAPAPEPSPTPTGTVTVTPTATPPPTPEPTVGEVVEVQFGVETAAEPTPPGDPSVTVREMSLSELDTEDPLVGPRAVINHSRRGPVEVGEECPCAGEPTLRANGLDAVTEVGQPINLSGTRSFIGQATGVDSQRRIIKLVDIQVPADRRDSPGVVRITVARGKFGTTDPREATIAHKTRGGWQLLDTRVVAATDRTVTLQARTTGFSPFAVFVRDEVRYRWSLPDGTAVDGKQARPQFDEPGVYNVTLTVTDAFGRSDTAVYRIVANDRPTVAIEGLVNASGDGPATLRANVTNEVGNVTVTWTFADGSTTTGLTVTRQVAIGETVRVLVEDEFGAQGRAEGVVGQAPGEGGRPFLGVVQFNLGLQTRLSVAGLTVVLLLRGLRWLTARRHELS